MKTAPCGDCKFRARYDRDPRSILGRLWRWHAGWCPGFKGYMMSLPQEERRDLARKYSLTRYQ